MRGLRPTFDEEGVILVGGREEERKKRQSWIKWRIKKGRNCLMVDNPCIRDKSRRAVSLKAEFKRCCTGSETTQEGRKKGAEDWAKAME